MLSQLKILSRNPRTIPELLSAAQRQEVELLLERWPFKPYVSHGRWSEEGLTALCFARAAQMLNSGAVAWVLRDSGQALGLITLTKLTWDTEQLGLKAARLDFLLAEGTYTDQYQAKAPLLVTALEYAKDNGIQHLSVQLDTSDLSGIHALEQAGFVSVDGILTFALDLDEWTLAEPKAPFNIRLATPADAEIAAALARQSYVYDRFHSDPAIPPERADELHAVWVRNSCNGSAADAVVLAEDESGMLGFVTCKLNQDTQVHLGRMIGTMVLVATAPHARGRGVGRAMTLSALHWFRAQGVGLVEVGTQLRNIPASRLYESCGFRLVNSSVSLRTLL